MVKKSAAVIKESVKDVKKHPIFKEIVDRIKDLEIPLSRDPMEM